jgi:hypothetical protein
VSHDLSVTLAELTSSLMRSKPYFTRQFKQKKNDTWEAHMPSKPSFEWSRGRPKKLRTIGQTSRIESARSEGPNNCVISTRYKNTYNHGMSKLREHNIIKNEGTAPKCYSQLSIISTPRPDRALSRAN